jgi:hypothetical protein
MMWSNTLHAIVEACQLQIRSYDARNAKMRKGSETVGEWVGVVIALVSSSLHGASLPVDFRLYLPKGWANDRARRKKAEVPFLTQ